MSGRHVASRRGATGRTVCRDGVRRCHEVAEETGKRKLMGTDHSQVKVVTLRVPGIWYGGFGIAAGEQFNILLVQVLVEGVH